MDNARASMYKLSKAEYDALLSAGLCDLCKTTGFIMNKARHDSGLVIDHCHKTGKVRGHLCHNCNRALGLLQDDTALLRRAIAYLERATTIPKGSTPK